MSQIWKYLVPMKDEFELLAPRGAKALSFQIQDGNPQVWVLADETGPLVNKQFRLVGTGHHIEHADTLSFIGTFQLHGGSLVFHLFEVKGI